MAPALAKTRIAAIAPVCIGSHAFDFGALQLGGLWRPHGGFLLELWHVDDSTTCFTPASFFTQFPYAISRVCVYDCVSS